MVLREYLEVEELVRDSDGDWPVRSGARAYVRVVGDPAQVTVFSPAPLGITRSPALLDAVNELNSTIRVAGAYVTDGEVVLAAEVDDQRRVGDCVITAFKAVSSLINSCGDDLQAMFGGNTFFGEATGPADRPRIRPMVCTSDRRCFIGQHPVTLRA